MLIRYRSGKERTRFLLTGLPVFLFLPLRAVPLALGLAPVGSLAVVEVARGAWGSDTWQTKCQSQ